MQAEYDNFAKFYDLEYSHKGNDLDFYFEMADTFGDPILEIGVGTGRVALDLAYEGFYITGIDNSKKMLDVAENNLVTLPEENRSLLELVHADMRTFKINKQFPLCIIPFRAFLHNLNQKDQLRTLKQIYDHLQPGGIVALDLFVPLYHLFTKEEWFDDVSEDELAEEHSHVNINIHVKHDPAEQVLRITNTYVQNGEPDQSATMHYRYIFRYEMQALLLAAGFKTLEVYGGFERQPYNYHSGIMVFIAQKQG